MSKEKSENNITQHVGDVNAKTIFGNPVLCLQFLKDNINIPLFKNLTPNDIEDVTERFTSYFGVEYEADTIKKLRIRSEDEEFDMYVVSLIDHKSYVDYNVSIQLLKYMACIWAEYEKEIMRNENESETEGLGRKSITRNKNFRYPPILLIVYYEGSDKWTADIHLKDRIMLSDVFEKYIPDYEYIVIRNHDYTNEELLSRQDEMSLLMIINKIQKAEDISEYLKLPAGEINKITEKSPKELINIIAAVVRSLCERVNATDEEKDECVRKVVGRQMGYLFENMEKMDIQAERQKTQEQKERADKAEERADKAEERADQAETQAGILQTQLEVFKMAKKEKSVEEIAKTLKIEVDEVHKILES